MQRKNHSIKNSNISEKGIGSFLSKILQDEKSGNYTPAPEDITQGEPVYNSVVDQVNAARDSALDMKKRFESINIADDPESAEKLKRELQQLQFESNRYRRVAQAPDQKPSFWRYIFHPFTRGQSRDQITTIDLDKRRLYASSIRDDMNLINSQAMILADIAQDVNLDTNFELKSFKVKASLQDSVNDIARYLDIMIDTLSKTSRDLTQAGKSVNTMNKIKSTRDNEEIATVNAALKYYKAMKETTKDIVTTKPKTKLFGFGGDDNPEGISTDELNDLMDGNSQAANQYSLDQAENLDPNAYVQFEGELSTAVEQATELYNSFDPSQPNPESQEVAQDLSQSLDKLNQMGQRFGQSDQLDPVTAGYVEMIPDMQQAIQPMIAQDTYQGYNQIGQYAGGSTVDSGYYRSFSTKKVDLKAAKNKLGKLIGALKDKVQKVKKKKQVAAEVKKKAKNAKKTLGLK